MKRFLLAASAALASSMPGQAQEGALTTDGLQQWLSGYEAAWENLDADAAAALFTEDATYQETPYAEPFRGRSGISEYWSTVTADQRDVDFTSEIIAIDGNIGVANWSARLASRSTGDRIELNGVFVLRFEPNGLCSELREWWFVQPIGD